MRDAATESAADADAARNDVPRPPRTLTVFDDVRISSIDTDPNFQRAEADVDFGEGPFASVKLVADLSSTCFPFERFREEPPPEGHHYPPSCDAFDRNFELTLDEPRSDGEPPAFELVRAITPFGGPLHVEQDITDLANARPGKHRVQVFIATWSDATGQASGSRGGWNVSTQLEVTPGAAPTPVLAAIPLENSRLDAKHTGFEAGFELPEGTRRVRLELRSTGHGGGDDATCFGPAEEFCDRVHTVWVDDQTLATLDLTRRDCGELCTLTAGPGGFEYCAENPTGLPQSVRAPRAGWCPGSVSPPQTWTLDVRGGGGSSHRFAYGVNRIAEGGVYRVSAVAYALGE